MLDLIVLGIVPGTSFVITLWWALLFALIAALGALVYVEIQKPRQTQNSTLPDSISSLSPAQQSTSINRIMRFPGSNLLLQRHKDTESTA